MFTWIPIHQETIRRIVEHRQNQNELLMILHEMEQQGLKVISLQDENADGQTIPLSEIDPFSFLATFNRGLTDKNRRHNWAFIKSRWNLNAAVPDDFMGIPILHNMTSRLFPYAVHGACDLFAPRIPVIVDLIPASVIPVWRILVHPLTFMLLAARCSMQSSGLRIVNSGMAELPVGVGSARRNRPKWVSRKTDVYWAVPAGGQYLPKSWPARSRKPVSIFSAL